MAETSVSIFSTRLVKSIAAVLGIAIVGALSALVFQNYDAQRQPEAPSKVPSELPKLAGTQIPTPKPAFRPTPAPTTADQTPLVDPNAPTAAELRFRNLLEQDARKPATPVAPAVKVLSEQAKAIRSNPYYVSRTKSVAMHRESIAHQTEQIRGLEREVQRQKEQLHPLRRTADEAKMKYERVKKEPFDIKDTNKIQNALDAMNNANIRLYQAEEKLRQAETRVKNETEELRRSKERLVESEKQLKQFPEEDLPIEQTTATLPQPNTTAKQAAPRPKPIDIRKAEITKAQEKVELLSCEIAKHKSAAESIKIDLNFYRQDYAGFNPTQVARHNQARRDLEMKYNKALNEAQKAEGMKVFAEKELNRLLNAPLDVPNE